MKELQAFLKIGQLLP
jgi:hypothetical protein